MIIFSLLFPDCPHPTNKINYLLVNKINPHEICSDVTKNTGSAIQLLFPPYQASKSKSNIYKKCGQRWERYSYNLRLFFTQECSELQDPPGPPHPPGRLRLRVPAPAGPILQPIHAAAAPAAEPLPQLPLQLQPAAAATTAPVQQRPTQQQQQQGPLPRRRGRGRLPVQRQIAALPADGADAGERPPVGDAVPRRRQRRGRLARRRTRDRHVQGKSK